MIMCGHKFATAITVFGRNRVSALASSMAQYVNTQPPSFQRNGSSGKKQDGKSKEPKGFSLLRFRGVLFTFLLEAAVKTHSVIVCTGPTVSRDKTHLPLVIHNRACQPILVTMRAGGVYQTNPVIWRPGGIFSRPFGTQFCKLRDLTTSIILHPRPHQPATPVQVLLLTQSNGSGKMPLQPLAINVFLRPWVRPRRRSAYPRPIRYLSSPPAGCWKCQPSWDLVTRCVVRYQHTGDRCCAYRHPAVLATSPRRRATVCCGSFPGGSCRACAPPLLAPLAAPLALGLEVPPACDPFVAPPMAEARWLDAAPAAGEMD